MDSLVDVERLNDPFYRRFLRRPLPCIDHIGIKPFCMTSLVRVAQEDGSGYVEFGLRHDSPSPWTSNLWTSNRPTLGRPTVQSMSNDRIGRRFWKPTGAISLVGRGALWITLLDIKCWRLPWTLVEFRRVLSAPVPAVCRFFIEHTFTAILVSTPVSPPLSPPA